MMSDLLEVIRAAIAEGATTEQKVLGAQACSTILAALDAKPGQLLSLPGGPQPHPLSGISLDQAFDLAIARLSAIANGATAEPSNAAPPRIPDPTPRIPLVKLPGSRGTPR